MGPGIAAGIRRLCLPCPRASQYSEAKQPRDRTPNQSAADAVKQPGRPRILWIDDEKTLSDPDIRFLNEEGFHVDCATTGTEGLALARTGDYQLILLDLKLPDVPGLSILGNLRAENVKTPVLVVTGFGDFESARVAGELGAVGFEGKPVFVDDLKLSIERHLGVVGPAPREIRNQLADREHDSGPATLRSLAILIETLHRLTQRSSAEKPWPDEFKTGREALIAALMRALLNPALPMRAFLACAEALKSTVTADPAESAFSLADKAQIVVLETLGRPQAKHPNVVAALAMLESAAADHRRLKGKEIARLEAVSQGHLSRLVDAETGFSFTKWRSAHLIRLSLTVLAETTEHVKQIACRLLRFSDETQFTHEFTTLFGMSPTEFRTRCQNNIR